MSEQKIWSVAMIGDATLYRFGDGTCCVFQDGQFSPASEVECFFLGKDRYWHRKGDRFDTEAEATLAFEGHLDLVKA